MSFAGKNLGWGLLNPFGKEGGLRPLEDIKGGIKWAGDAFSPHTPGAPPPPPPPPHPAVLASDSVQGSGAAAARAAAAAEGRGFSGTLETGTQGAPEPNTALKQLLGD